MTIEQATGHLADAIVEIAQAVHELPPDEDYDVIRDECRRLQLRLNGLSRRIDGSDRYLRERKT